MFDSGVPNDQFHQFKASSRNQIPLPLPFPLHGVSSSSAAPPPPPSFSGCFDPYSQTLPPPPPTHHHHQSGLQQSTRLSKHIGDNEEKEEESAAASSAVHVGMMGVVVSTNLRLDERERSDIDDSWSNDEVLALLRIRSSFENWFPEFTWEHVSRKLSELGFQRSAEKCKEKFEEESRQFNNMNYNKTYSFFSELDELYQGENPPAMVEKIQNLEKENGKELDEDEIMEEPNNPVEADAENNNNIVAVTKNNPCDEMVNHEEMVMKISDKKRKRKDKFEMFKGFCEALVKKIMAQQEELNSKILQDVLKKEEEHIAKEEAWRREEIERINREIEIRARELTISGDRQAKIIQFLKKFASDDQNLKSMIDDFVKVTNSTSSTSTTSSCEILSPKSYINTPYHQEKYLKDQGKLEVETSSNKMIISPQKNPSLLTSSSHNSTSMAWQNPKDRDQVEVINPLVSGEMKDQIINNSATNERVHSIANEGSGDIGKRWPRDEVLALINLRCSLNNNSNEENKEASAKGPLWERISQGMLELGYKRSAKRCKEKWENINKYFRKTKDNKEKRSTDSRTCPYFHQLSSLYSQGTPAPENRQTSPGNS